MHPEHAARGNAADLLYNVARYDEAEAEYLALYDDVRAAGPVDMRVAAKIALGLLLTFIESGQLERAHALWTARPAEPLGEGIFAIERGFAPRADLMAYQVVSSFLHALATDNGQAATEAVNTRMQAVCDYARKDDAALWPVAIKCWKQFLTQLHGPDIEPSALSAAAAEEARYGKIVPLDGDLELPVPAPWE